MAEPKTHHRWRENLEALTMAIVVALLFKYFVLEISKIPSGSMQPTLMGLNLDRNGDGKLDVAVNDRTLVDKLSYRFRDPRRFEIVVFKHPLERSRIMVKRLVGMPGEELKIENGDLWTRRTADEPWKVLRRPPRVQRAMWRELRRERTMVWGVVRGGKEWRVASDTIVARGDGAARFRPDAGPITDDYRDGYPSRLAGEIAMPEGSNPVGDVRLAGEVVALDGTSAVTIELTEGQRVYEFTLPGPAAPEDATVSVRIRDSAASSERVEHGERFRLAAGARVSLAAENLDDRLALEVEGRTLLAAEIPASERQEASITVGVTGAGAELSELRVARDTYYQLPRESRSWKVEIPPGSYVMLGDNAHDSADSRLWEAKTFEYRPGNGPERPEETIELRGNFRNGENPLNGRLRDGTAATRFRDHWGEPHWFPRSAVVPQRTFPGNGSIVNEPLVPRDLIVGRAIAVFWPIRPFQKLWRIGWLH